MKRMKPGGRSLAPPKTQRGTVVADAGAALKSIFKPLASKVDWVAQNADVVFVVHRPGALAMSALSKLGLSNESVFGMSSFDAARVAKWDVLTRKWLSEPAEMDNQLKVFLFAGDGTALLTLTFTEAGVQVDKAPDIFLAGYSEGALEMSAPTESALTRLALDDHFGSGKTSFIVDGAHRMAIVGKDTSVPPSDAQPLVVISNEHGVVVGRQFLEEIAAGKRSPQTVLMAAGPFAELQAAYGAAIDAEPIRVVLPPM